MIRALAIFAQLGHTLNSTVGLSCSSMALAMEFSSMFLSKMRGTGASP